MNIIVCIKLVPSVTDVTMDKQFNMVRDSVVQVINPADESALEAARRLKGNGCVTVLTMGKQSGEAALRSLISRGADKAVLVSDRDFAGSDTFATANTLSAAIKYLGDFDLILCGRRAIDGETGQVPPELATLLNVPFVTNATNIRIEDTSLKCSRLLEDGTEELSLSIPAVISFCEYSYPLGLPSIMGLRRANQTQIMTLTREILGINKKNCGLSGSPTRVKSITRQLTGVRNVTIAENTDEGIKRMNELVREVQR